ncbi:hypothetical protein CAPTEDRAFT_167265 [Capitella teleta]|uniref:C2H2-type domain-containing protein n=1 Tax=Capitella teleta TaxID=283909 RepID=R7VB60_CAPTE|nr:hypothetical protein CAPTEDRAFT_167265 [Capitella teleta]|eukprot:ELU15767.1 hypothetical protein CAPTEDRAFT_167265 [Capitella teleta]
MFSNDLTLPSTDNDVQLGHKYVKKRDYEAQCGYKFFCKICSFKSKRQSHYDNHIRLHQNSHSLFKCSKCSFTALRLNHLRRHEQTHIAQKVLQCAKCPYKSLKQELMARHCQKRHQMQAKTSEAIYKCRSCDYKTNRQHLIVRHLRVHSITDATNDCVEKIVKSYQCPKCDYATSRKENYLRHMNNIHLPVRPYLCDTCGKSFKRQDSLRTHAAVHLDRTKRQFPFKCYVCQKGLRSKAHLKEHLTTHSSQRAYLCEICGAAFKTRSVQRKHVQSIHQNPQSFYCMECPKTFNTKYSLLRHSKTHKNANQQLLLTDERNEIILPQLAADEMHQIQIEYPTGEIVTQPIVQVPPGLLQSTDDLSEEDKNGVLTTASLEGSAVMGSAEGFDQSIVQHMEARTLLSADTSSSALFYLN